MAATMFLNVGAACDSSAERPNILIVMTDDLRIGMLSSEGHPYAKTPHLDRLADEGVRFNNCYALTPVCGPSRASAFTGQHSSLHMRRDNFYYPDRYEHYLPQHFKDAGYRTALIGKYYEGNAFRPTARKAWDRWFVNKGPAAEKRKSGMSHEEWWNKFLYVDQMYDVDGQSRQIRGHQTDILFDEAARFTSEKSEKPFCLFLSPFAPHVPLNMTDRNRGKYQGKGLPARANQELDQGFFKTPGKAKKITQEYEKYCEMIADIDDGMGRLFAALEQSDQLNNTLIVFTSDNGLLFGEHGFAAKRHAWEESIKVPFYVRFPKLAKPGSECDAIVCLADIFFTCADVAGVQLPAIEGSHGRSLTPLLTEKRQQVRDQLVCLQYEMTDRDEPSLPEKLLWATLLRADGWKLTVYNVPPDQRPELARQQLFNLGRDRVEMANLASSREHRRVLESLREQLKSELDQIKADSSWLK